jgi:hypothetical protein
MIKATPYIHDSLHCMTNMCSKAFSMEDKYYAKFCDFQICGEDEKHLKKGFSPL